MAATRGQRRYNIEEVLSVIFDEETNSDSDESESERVGDVDRVSDNAKFVLDLPRSDQLEAHERTNLLFLDDDLSGPDLSSSGEDTQSDTPTSEESEPSPARKRDYVQAPHRQQMGRIPDMSSDEEMQSDTPGSSDVEFQPRPSTSFEPTPSTSTGRGRVAPTITTSGQTTRSGRTRTRGQATRGRTRPEAGRPLGRGAYARRQQQQPDEWRRFNDDVPPVAENHFTGHPGPNRRALSLHAEQFLEHFQLFIDDALVDNIIIETNKYAEKSRIQKPSTMNWSDVSREELLAFLGMNIAMGIVRLPQIDDFFATEPIISHPWFPSIMSRGRFEQIARYLHVSDEENFPNDKLSKLRPVIDQLTTSFPSREITIDEQMIGTRCRVGFIQYMPAKPIRFGVKNWVLCDAHNGYVCNFQIYTGKADDNVAEVGLAQRVVRDLMVPYVHAGHRLYTDNFYTCPELSEHLLTQNTQTCGTVRQARIGYPVQLRTATEAKYKRGDSKFFTNGRLVACRWKDKRDVFTLSTFHNHGSKISEDEPHKPHIILDYNIYMNGVDRNDQLLSYYALNRGSIKWWKKVFWRLLELAIVNSYIIYKLKVPKMTHKKFRLQLCHSLVDPLLAARTEGNVQPGPGRPVAGIGRLTGKHYPSGASKGMKRRRCKVCSKEKKANGKYKDTKTANRCEKCDVHLCVGECFRRYHSYSRI